MSFAGSLPLARSTTREMKTKAMGTAIEKYDVVKLTHVNTGFNPLTPTDNRDGDYEFCCNSSENDHQLLKH